MANLADEGLLGTGATLAARLLVAPNIFLTNITAPNSTTVVAGQYLGGTGMWIESPWFVGVPHGSFPYGEQVEPP